MKTCTKVILGDYQEYYNKCTDGLHLYKAVIICKLLGINQGLGLNKRLKQLNGTNPWPDFKVRRFPENMPGITEPYLDV